MLKKLLISSTLISTLSLCSASAASAIFSSNTWEIGLTGTVLYEGNEGDFLQDEALGFGLRAGYRFADSWEAVIEISSQMNADTNRGIKVDIMDYIASVNYDFFPQKSSYTPYLALGFGYRTISDVSGRDNWNIIPGLGIKWLISDSIQVSLEGKGRWNLEMNEKGLIGTLGISYVFGNR